jgi:hypothetical protein
VTNAFVLETAHIAGLFEECLARLVGAHETAARNLDGDAPPKGFIVGQIDVPFPIGGSPHSGLCGPGSVVAGG